MIRMIKNTYGEYYRIKEFNDGKWIEVKKVNDNVILNTKVYKVDANNNLEFKINWTCLYG